MLSFFLFIAASAFAQTPAPPAVSTAAPPAVDLSSGSAPPVDAHGLQKAGEQPAAVLKNPIAVRIHKESSDWEPVGVHAGGDPGQAANAFSWRVSKKHTKSSKATAVARVHPVKDDKMLVIALYPTAMKKRGLFFEIRCLISEGWLDAVKVAAVTVKADPRFKWGADDSFTLTRKGIEFGEDFPSEGALRFSALSPRGPNSGKLTGADFGGQAYDKDALKVVSFSFSAARVLK